MLAASQRDIKHTAAIAQRGTPLFAVAIVPIVLDNVCVYWSKETGVNGWLAAIPRYTIETTQQERERDVIVNINIASSAFSLTTLQLLLLLLLASSLYNHRSNRRNRIRR